jgi:cytochrome c oxidase assembly protein subunit 15
MDDAAWQAEFAKYQAIPEYQLQNKGMTLEAFKSIYWWEWGHRQLGRLIGLVWFVGFVGFALARQIPPGWTGRLCCWARLEARRGRSAGGWSPRA